MKVTLITATYNSEKNILSTLESIKSQDYSNIEWIVVDGVSKDNTLKIIEENLSDFKGGINIQSEADTGIYNALNKGIALATGDLIGFVHSDDFLAGPQVIENIVATLQQTNTNGIYGDLNYVSSENESKIVRQWKGKTFKRVRLNWGWMPAHPTLFLKKEVYERHGVFDESFRIAADYDFMLRILSDSAHHYHYLPQVVSHMRLGGVSSATSNLRLKMKEDLRAMRKNGVWFPVFTLVCKNLRKLGQFF